MRNGNRSKLGRRGFTLIELMIVVAIIGILAAIAIPKFAELIRKSNEGSAKGNLGALRSALSIYYGDMEGLYPANLVAITVNGKYMSAIPKGKAPNYHVDTATARENDSTNAVNDGGGWGYVNFPGDSNFGTLWVNCTHTDTKGSVWTTY